LLSLLEFVPKTAKALEEEPDTVIRNLEDVRKYCEWESTQLVRSADGSA
jgi:hypothetical protein